MSRHRAISGNNTRHDTRRENRSAAFAIDSLVVSTAGVAVIVGGADVVAERTAATINRTPAVVVDEAAVGLTLRWEAGRARGLGLAAGAHEF